MLLALNMNKLERLTILWKLLYPTTCLRGTIMDRKNVPSATTWTSGALRLPTLARHQPITCLIQSLDRQLQRTDVQVVGGGRFFCLRWYRYCRVQAQ